jgi:hypothetical protein
MIYTCYEMIRDCRADRPEGWRHFIARYVPVIRKFLARYQAGGPPDAPALEQVLERVMVSARQPQSSLFQSQEPAPERWFVAELRQKVLEELPSSAPAAHLDLETVAAALEPLTLVEKQVAWLETMLYSPTETAVLLRMAPSTAEKIRGKAANLLRGQVDSWSRTMLEENGRTLGRAAAAATGEECLLPKTFLDMVDGRTTWQGRDQLERHVTRCWHCIDHFCRLVEVVEVLRGNQPLTEAEAAPFRARLGVQEEKRPVWKRWMSGRGKG